MNTPPTTHREIELAHSDWALIGLSTRYARQDHTQDTYDRKPWRAVVIDGSGLSPAWRRLRGGEAVWDEELDQELYVETLDRLVEGFNASSECALVWEDGTLLIEFAPEER
jgi:hypothetical protein